MIKIILFLIISISQSEELLDNVTWKLSLEKEGIKVYGGEIPDSEIMIFKANGILTAPIHYILSTLRDVEKSSEWIPNLIQKSTIKNISDLEAITYNYNYLPWPLDNRDLILLNKLNLDKKRKLLVVEAYSVESKDQPPQEGRVRAIMKYGNMGFRPLNKNETYVEILVHVDPKGMIPAWVVNFVQRNWSIGFLKSLEKRALQSRSIPNKGIINIILDLYKILPNIERPNLKT